MPNLRGGKAYKKGKKTASDKEEVVQKFLQRDTDQEYARVIRMLGNRRVICFCNDGRERNCKIRGALCKGPNKQKITVGDIVLLSFRDFEVDSEDDSTDESEHIQPPEKSSVQHSGVADIIYKFHRDHWRHIKKESNIHIYLFSAEDPSGKKQSILDDLFDYNSDEEKTEFVEPVPEKVEEELKKFTDIEDDDIDAI